jgi:adenylylsulfate kinase
MSISRQQREQRNRHRAAIVWLTGLSGAGKTTLAYQLERTLFEQGHQVVVLDGDAVRHGLCGDLGFSLEARRENIRRISEVARLFADAGMIVIVAFISPLQADRERARQIASDIPFIQAYCSADLATCSTRDVKGLYRRALAGEIPNFTGISSPYEVPTAPDLVLDTQHLSIEACTTTLMHALERAMTLSSTN